MSSQGYVQLVPKFNSFSELNAFLDEPEEAKENEVLPALNLGGLSLSQVILTVQDLAKKRWNFPEQEIDRSFEIIQKIRKSALKNNKGSCPCCFSFSQSPEDPMLKIESLEKHLREVKKFHQYVKKYKEEHLKEIQNSNQSRYILPEQSSLTRAFHTDSNGRIFVHLNRKKMGDLCLGEGAEKRVKIACELGTFNKFITAGYKVFNPTEFENLRMFKGIPGFIQLIEHLSYNKKNRIKFRAIFEFCNYGDLYDAIIGKKLNESNIKTIFIELVKNIALMHRMGYLHRDLKLENIFLQQQQNGLILPIIGDFGSVCKDTDEIARREFHRISPPAISPDYARAIISKDSKKLLEANSMYLDCWGLGCILYALLDVDLHTSMPQEDKNLIRYLASRRENWLPEPQNKNSAKHLAWEILQKKLLVIEAEERLSQIDWSNH
jgi:serine/threonine protein kinase